MSSKPGDPGAPTDVSVLAALAAAASLSPEADSLVDRVSKAFEELTGAAAEINTVSDQFGKPIADIEAELKRLNLGVPAWVAFAAGRNDDHDVSWEHMLGYEKHNGKWSITISIAMDGEREGDTWAFTEAPRSFRAEAVDKLPELLERLAADARATAERLKESIDKTKQIAAALNPSADFKEKLLSQIKSAKAVFYNMVVAQAQRIDVIGNEVIFSFTPAQKTLVSTLEQNREWLESVASGIGRRKITVRTAQVSAPAKK